MNDRIKRVAIIDYELGNMFSVKKACDSIGVEAIITTDKREVMRADAAILPGVGAFGDAMNNLGRLDLIEPIKDFIQSKKPFLGICLGLQLLFTESEEFGAHDGLNIIDGIVRKFHRSDKKIKVPQIGWNHISKNLFTSEDQWNASPLHDIDIRHRMYFVHSFYVIPTDGSKSLTMTSYEGVQYCSSILSNNIFATQFHPEKSSEVGLRIYRNWASQITCREDLRL